MKLEVGMYCRYNGRISKISRISRQTFSGLDNTIEATFHLENDRIIKYPNNNFKVSHNIIDLIENKDLCEIEFYSFRYNERVTRLFEVEIITDTYINFKNARCEFVLINKQWNSEDLELKPVIKNVLTHEQFENNCFRIGDK